MVRDKNFYKTIFKISLPAAFSSLVSFLVVVADDIMVSNITSDAVSGIGKLAQSAVSQINALTAFYTATLLGLVSGSGVLIAQYWGKKDVERIRRIFSMIFVLSAAVSVLFVLAASLFPRAIASLVIGKEETEVMKLALEYFAIVCFSYIPYAVTNSLTGMLRSVEVVRITLYVSVCSLIMNIVLNYAFIFGFAFIPSMGVKGAAIATVITRIIEMLIVCVYTFRVQKVIEIKPKDLLTFDRILFKDYARYGLPVGFTDMQWALVGMMKAAIIGQMGAAFIAASMAACADAPLDMLMFYDARPGGMNSLYCTDRICECLKGYYPFRMFNELYKLPAAVEAAADEGLYACAAAGDSAAVMLTNYSDDDAAPGKPVRIEMSGFAGENGVKASFFMLDETHDMELVKEEYFTAERCAAIVAMKNHSTILIKLEKL